MDGGRRAQLPGLGGTQLSTAGQSQPAAEGELFVPFSVLPAAGTAQEAPLAIHVRSVEGLVCTTSGRLSIELRFGPLVSGLRVDKSKEVSVKCHMDLFREKGGGASSSKWLPSGYGSARGALRVVLPPMLLSQSGRGVACRVKVTTPGLMSMHALAVSAPVSVPLEPGAVPLNAAKASQGRASPVATAMLSIGRLFSAEAQAVMARSLVSQLLRHFRRPQTGVADAPKGQPRLVEQNSVPAELDALRPSRGWLDSAGLPQAFCATDTQRRTALRLAVDGQRWGCVQALVEARCDLRALAEDLRSPLTAALESGEQLEVLFASDGSLGLEPQRVAREFAHLLEEGGTGGSGSGTGMDFMKRWEVLVEDLVYYFQPMPPSSLKSRAGGASAARWPCDIFVLALEHCPSGKARRTFLCSDGTCSALWQASLQQNLPNLARKLAVWIGLSVTGSSNEGRHARRRLLDVPLDSMGDTMLARCLQRATEDERWLQVARVMVHLGACTNSATADGRSCLLFTLEQADQGKAGFRPLLAALLDKLGDDIDQWEHPMVLQEDRTAECPICMEVLWTSTPTAFVTFRAEGGTEGVPHVICAHFFCFDCASQQYIKQQTQRADGYHCPICRAPANEVMPLPDITREPRLWFQFLDIQGSGRLDRNTVVQALEAVLPIDTENLREAMDAQCWSEWDKAGNKQLSEHDFFAQEGLLEWVRGHQHELQAARVRGAAPPLEEEPESWHKHWDIHRRNMLSRGEALRALCEATSTSSLELKKVGRLKEGIQCIWEKHASEGCLSKEVFLEREIFRELGQLVSEARAKKC